MRRIPIGWILVVFWATCLWGQNCFLEDWTPKEAVIPPFVEARATVASPTVTVTIDGSDTLHKVSRYLFGNAVAVWVSRNQNNPVLVGHLKKLAPTLIRFPGGSWSDIYFWNGNPGDLPPTIPDGTQNGRLIPLYPQFGPNLSLTPDEYDAMRDALGAQGLITVNYGYARYGTGRDPVARAAHLAAEWVRKDDGRTLFWEIGNENAGPWEAGWQIDRSRNQDGQPEIISGELYGRHFRVFADSMRKAAAEIGATIYIGAQILHYNAANDHWNPPNKTWNEGVFREIGDAADFYVIHNYFGSGSSTDARTYLARSIIDLPRQMMQFIQSEIKAKGASPKPIAITEWNISAPDEVKTSVINALQGVILLCEFIKHGYGLSARWLVANWEGDGMFYFGNNPHIPLWNPRPDFYAIALLQRFVGDHVVSATSNHQNLLAYGTLFAGGEMGIVLINKGTTDEVIRLRPVHHGFGERVYVYVLTGVPIGQEKPELPQAVKINGEGPDPVARTWGPLEDFEAIPAYAYPIEEEIRLEVPARGIVFALLESGHRMLSRVGGWEGRKASASSPAIQVFPMPSWEAFTLTFTPGRFHSLMVLNVRGQLVYSRRLTPEEARVTLGEGLPAGTYVVRLMAPDRIETRKAVILR